MKIANVAPLPMSIFLIKKRLKKINSAYNRISSFSRMLSCFSILALSPVKNFLPGLTTIFSMTLKKG